MIRVLLWILLFSVVTFAVLGCWYLLNPEQWRMTSVSALSLPKPINNLLSTLPSSEDNGYEEIQSLSEYHSSYSCHRSTSAVKPARTEIHYKWIDQSGVTNFSDTPPMTGETEILYLDGSGKPEYFNLDIDFKGASYVPHLKHRLSAQTTAIYEVLSGFVGKQSLRFAEVNLTILPDREKYLNYSRSVTGKTMSTTGGFFSPSKNEAVTYQYPDKMKTFEVARHETTHVILHVLLGKLPLWLNEGLAEYFEQMTMTGQLVQIEMNDEWLGVARSSIKNGYPDNLANYLQLSYEQWNRRNTTQHYAIAWSFIYFLSSSLEGKHSLSVLMAELSSKYCDDIDGVESLAQSYPGGFEILENDFFNWILHSDKKQHHRY